MDDAGPTSAVTVALTAGFGQRWISETSAPVLTITDREAFRTLLAGFGPAVVVVCVPPATRTEIEAVAAARRTRHDIRAVLIDRPKDRGERLVALRAGFDAALDTRIDSGEVASRIELLREEILGPGPRMIELSPVAWLDEGRRELVVHGSVIHLRPREYALLDVLARHPGRTFGRLELLEAVGAGPRTGDLRSVDVHVTWLRDKLDRAGAGAPIVATVRGVGYRLDPPTEPTALTER